MSLVSLDLVFIGSSLNNRGESNTPSLIMLNDLINLCAENDVFLKIHLVDPNYHYIPIRKVNDDDTKENRAILDEKERISSISEISLEHLNIVPKYYYFSELQLQGSLDNVIYISYVKEYKTSFAVMNLVKDYDVENKYFIPSNYIKKNSLMDIVENYIKYKNEGSKPLYLSYNICSGDKWEDGKYLDTRDDLEDIIDSGLRLLQHYISANIHLEETSYPTKKIPNWCYNVETPILKAIINYFKLITENEIHRPANEICESADYRRLLCTILAKILSNYAVNNDLITIKEVKNDDWFNLKIYKKIQDRMNE